VISLLVQRNDRATSLPPWCICAYPTIVLKDLAKRFGYTVAGQDLNVDRGKKFADDSGHTAAEFYTNRTLVHLMTLMLGAGASWSQDLKNMSVPKVVDCLMSPLCFLERFTS